MTIANHDFVAARGRVATLRVEPMVEVLATRRPGGRVLDCGAGSGVHSLYLARRGIAVDAVDISDDATTRLNAAAVRESLPLVARTADIRNGPWHGCYAAVIVSRVLHQLPPGDAASVVARMKRHTRPGGVHVIIALAKRGDLYDLARMRGRERRFFVDTSSLCALYADWRIVQLHVQTVCVRQRVHADRPSFNQQIALMARRPGVQA